MPAYTIAQLETAGPLSKAELYVAIGDGSLVARKRGKKTIILAPDWENFLNELPRAGVDIPLAEPEHLRGSNKTGRAPAGCGRAALHFNRRS
jgi:hypothetical protein